MNNFETEIFENPSEESIIYLEELKDSNINELLKIEVQDFQIDNVPSIEKSINSALTCPGTKAFSVKNSQGQVVGFLSYGLPEGSKIPKIFRILIDKNHQGKKYGKYTLNLAIERALNEYNTNEVELCYNQLDESLKAFYSKAGFVDIEIQPCDTRPTGKMLARYTKK